MIVNGEAPSYKIYEDEKTIALLDIHPVVPGHTLIITKDPNSKNILDIDTENWSAMCETTRKMAIVLEKAMRCDGVNVIMNNRQQAGQLVDHPHIHLIPRYKGDGFNLWPHGSYREGEAEQVLERIQSALQ